MLHQFGQLAQVKGDLAIPDFSDSGESGGGCRAEVPCPKTTFSCGQCAAVASPTNGKRPQRHELRGMTTVTQHLPLGPSTCMRRKFGTGVVGRRLNATPERHVVEAHCTVHDEPGSSRPAGHSKLSKRHESSESLILTTDSSSLNPLSAKNTSAQDGTRGKIMSHMRQPRLQGGGLARLSLHASSEFYRELHRVGTASCPTSFMFMGARPSCLLKNLRPETMQGP